MRPEPEESELPRPDAAGATGWVLAGPAGLIEGHALRAVRVRGRDLLIVRDGDRLVACERACPHEQADLALGRVRDGRLHCPRHQASFCLGDGRISPGWTCRALRLFPARREGDMIQIRPGPG